MCHPAHDTCHSEYRGVYLLWQTNHLVYETRVEIDVGAYRLLGVAVSLYTLDAFLLEQTQKLVFLLSALLLCQFACKALQLLGSWVAQSVYSMTDAIDKSALVVHLLIENTVEIGVNLVHGCPVLYLFLKVMNHVNHLDVGSSVQRTLKRAYAGGNARVGVGAA